MNLVLKLDLDMAKIYHHVKSEVSLSTHSKVTGQKDKHTDTTTHCVPTSFSPYLIRGSLSNVKKGKHSFLVAVSRGSNFVTVPETETFFRSWPSTEDTMDALVDKCRATLGAVLLISQQSLTCTKN